MKTSFKITLPGLVFALALLCAPALKAQLFSFNVDLNTATLNSAGSTAPFYLDFQLNQGSGSLPSTVTFGDFHFTGGNFTPGTVAVPFGAATGSLASSVSMTADGTNPVNEFYQGFGAGVTDIKFTATVSQNFTGLMPTGLSIAILDSSFGAPAQIYTTQPLDGGGLSLVTLDVGAANKLSDVQTFSSASPSPLGVTASVSAIPEPSYTVAMFGGLVGAFAAVRRMKTRRLA